MTDSAFGTAALWLPQTASQSNKAASPKTPGVFVPMGQSPWKAPNKEDQ